MKIKKAFLIGLLIFFSLLLSTTLANLDFFGFITGGHTLNLALIFLSLLVSYFLSVVVFILDFSDRKNLIRVYLASCVFFGILFFIFTTSFFRSALSTVFFLLFLLFTYHKTTERSRLFVKFSPKEILHPVVKKAFLFLIAIFAVLSFSQTKTLLAEDNLISVSFLRTISKPVVIALNKQFAAQLEARLGLRFERAIGSQNREEIVQFVLSEIVESMSEGQVRQALGFNPKSIPIEKTIVYENGEIELTPVVEEILPKIAVYLNKRFSRYIIFLPFLISALLILTLIPIALWPFEFITLFLTPLIFSLLFYFKVIEIGHKNIQAERVTL